MGQGTYTIFSVGDDGVAGAADMPPGVPDEVPAYRLTIFAVDDADAAVEKLRELGAAW